MSKIRIIPTLLTDGLTIVKGEEFNSWRSVGSTQAAARLFSYRDVDELMLLDVMATRQNRSIELRLVEEFSELLSIPFAVGGGLKDVDIARKVLRSGAEKIVVGTAAYLNPNFVSKLSSEFGSQAIVVALDIVQNSPFQVAIKSGSEIINVELESLISSFSKIGVGEILIQSKQHDGKMKGMNFSAIKMISNLTDLPLIASSGAGTEEDFYEAITCGASAVAAGALFQFTEVTPKSVRNYLQTKNVKVRIS
jgi:cyclase